MVSSILGEMNCRKVLPYDDLLSLFLSYEKLTFFTCRVNKSLTARVNFPFWRKFSSLFTLPCSSFRYYDVKSLFTWHDNFSSCSAKNSFFSALFPVVSLSQMRKCLGFFFPYFTTPTCNAQLTCVTLKNSFSTFLNTLNFTRGNYSASFFILSQDKRRFASVLELTHTEKFEKSQARVRGGKVWRKKKSFWYFHICCSIWRVQMLRFIRTCRT